jgi:ferric-dicitrate binding protein FerR (iron transport regulator)
MRQLAGEGWDLLDHLPAACFENAEAGLRELREQASQAARAPHRPRPSEQQARKHQDALPVVSQALASALRIWWVIPGFPLSSGIPARVGRLRGYGNAIVPPLAAEFIRAVMDAAA